MGLEQSGLEKLIHAAFDLLGLMTFLTAGLMSVGPGLLLRAPLHQRQQARFIPILSVALFGLKL